MGMEGKRRSRVTLLDVARHAGISRATASLVIRKSPLVGAETRARVEASMHELGYVYNLGAARLRADRSLTIGVVIPNLTNPFFIQLLAGIETVIDSAGMVVLLVNSNDVLPRQEALLTRMREQGVDGIILCPAAGTDPDLVTRMAEWNMPVVQVLRHVSDECDYAGVDYALGMRQAVDHLAELGHRDIAFAVHGPVHSAYQERVDGFRQAMEAHGFASDRITRVPHQISAIARSAELFSSGLAKPSAVVCFNDVVALGLSAGLYDLGLRIGQDFSLVGFDDVADAEAMRPRLTSVATFPEAIGEGAAGLLLDRLTNPDLEPRRLVKAAQLHIRQSCTAYV
ncbi:LacI family DNA-binding transcriptional regulator [Neorhizobium sp. NCHU2750]|uniref:LacI family DNA-binding transcriptional regulator n=1 Tax=Neorhizobium sp. NCHU2750 TaxID=1825976 RepID=UPI000E73C82A|nr:LacI family transcriptional regulator [Neorhizobium sp. NCHU2750]